MKVHLQYGKDGIEVDLPAKNVDVITPAFVEGLPDEAAAFREALRAPIGARPLKETIRSGDRVAVVIPDITRPFPADRLLPVLFGELSHVSPENFVIVNGTGSHRANTDAELAAMLGPAVFGRYRVVNHDSGDPSALLPAGRLPDGHPVLLNREYVGADRRIVMGFIEPHFMAGFSGGWKAVLPGVVDLKTIMHYHRADVIADPRSTWGVLDGNPTQGLIRAGGSLLPVDFCVNVTLNRSRRITRFFCGGVAAAHQEGCAFSRRNAMRPCPRPYPVVVTTNSGYPLDQNLYQTVKGMSAAAQIVEKGGLILAASKCDDGFPSHGNFRKLLFEHATPQALLDTILRPGYMMHDQWEAQLLANSALKARAGLFSGITDADVRRAWLEPVADIAARVGSELDRIGRDAPVAVLPEGPMTIPYLAR